MKYQVVNRPLTFFVLSVFATLGGPISHVFAQPRQQPETWNWIDKNIAEGCEHATHFSNAMQREIGYSIYLPPSYQDSPDRRYPVVYYLHGASGSESSSREFAWAVQQGIKDEAIAETIYVFPNGGHYSGYRDWKDGAVKAETWIIQELIPHIDATYRTIPSREKRALCGWSMGGGGSLRFLTKYPEMFCAAATIGAALNMRGGDPEDSAETHLQKNADQLRGRVGIWMAVGEEDRLKAGNESFSQALKQLGIEHSLKIHPRTGHNLGQMSAHFHREIVLMLDQHLKTSAESSGQVRVLRDIPYKHGDTLTDYERERCTLDWYLPAGSAPLATIVWFHGGGLTNGHKADDIAMQFANRFAGEGIGVASVNYRLSPRVKYPAYVDDAAAAVAFVYQNVESHGGSKDCIFVSGHSAGGYLAAMVCLNQQLLMPHSMQRASLAGCIPVAGQMVTHSTVRGERGIPRTCPIIDEAAPLYHVSQAAPPFLCFAGDHDLPMRSEENRYFASAMRAAGHTSVEFVEVRGRDHGTIASRVGEAKDEVAYAILKFVEAHCAHETQPASSSQ